jgi:hypothetical protein
MCAVGFYVNIYNVTKTQNIKLPNIGDHVTIKLKLQKLIAKLTNKFNDSDYYLN